MQYRQEGVFQEQNNKIDFNNVVTSKILSLKIEFFYTLRQYSVAEVVDTYYRYEPIWNYRFLYKAIWLLERYLYILRKDYVEHNLYVDYETIKLETPMREVATYVAFASICIIVSDEELVNILLQKRFQSTLNRENFDALVAALNSIIKYAEIVPLIPTFTPYDLSDEDKGYIKQQWPKSESFDHITNIFNYLINSFLQHDFVTISFEPLIIQKSALWLACRYFSTNDEISKLVALKSLQTILSNQESKDRCHIKLENLIKESLGIMENEVLRAMRIVQQRTTS